MTDNIREHLKFKPVIQSKYKIKEQLTENLYDKIRIQTLLTTEIWFEVKYLVLDQFYS